jgi:luciferase-type oxidoreductase
MTHDPGPAPDPGHPAHPGFTRVFPPGRMTLGLMFPIEAYAGPIPEMKDQVRLARAAEAGGFAAVWARDVPLLDYTFGDGGQLFDTWAWLAHVGALTEHIALGTASVVLPLRHPLHTAKAAASVDVLTDGRLLLGVATGDRPVEFPLFGEDYLSRGESFRRSLELMQLAWSNRFTDAVAASRVAPVPGVAAGVGAIDILPKPAAGRVPVLVTGRSQQDMGWIAENADAWLTYPRPLTGQAQAVTAWHTALVSAGQPEKPFAQSLYIDLAEAPDTEASGIHLGYRLGRDRLLDHLRALRAIGVGHVMLNLKYGRRPAAEVVDELAEFVVPEFSV